MIIEMDAGIWTAIGVGVAAMSMFGAFMTFVLRLMVVSAIKDAMLEIAEKKYITQNDLDRHKESCLARIKEGT